MPPKVVPQPLTYLTSLSGCQIMWPVAPQEGVTAQFFLSAAFYCTFPPVLSTLSYLFADCKLIKSAKWHCNGRLLFILLMYCMWLSMYMYVHFWIGPCGQQMNKEGFPCHNSCLTNRDQWLMYFTCCQFNVYNKKLSSHQSWEIFSWLTEREKSSALIYS